MAKLIGFCLVERNFQQQTLPRAVIAQVMSAVLAHAERFATALCNRCTHNMAKARFERSLVVFREALKRLSQNIMPAENSAARVRYRVTNNTSIAIRSIFFDEAFALQRFECLGNRSSPRTEKVRHV